MKKFVFAVLFTVAGVSSASVTFEFFNTNSSSFFSLTGLSTAVVTNDGLIATFSVNTGTMNRVGSYGFGITGSGVSGGTTSTIDPGEFLYISFDKDVEITVLDFRQFTAGETFNVFFDSTDHWIAFADLSGSAAIYSNINWSVSAGTVIEFSVASGSSISLDGFTVSVIPEPAVTVMSVAAAAAVLFFIRRFHRR